MGRHYKSFSFSSIPRLYHGPAARMLRKVCDTKFGPIVESIRIHNEYHSKRSLQVCVKVKSAADIMLLPRGFFTEGYSDIARRLH